MHLNIEKIIGSIVGALVFLKAFFWLFSTGEIFIMILVPTFAFIAYGIQRVEWVESSPLSILGIQIYRSESILSRWTLFGIIPISGTTKLYVTREILPKGDSIIKQNLLLTTKNGVRSLLPFGGYLTIGKRKE